MANLTYRQAVDTLPVSKPLTGTEAFGVTDTKNGNADAGIILNEIAGYVVGTQVLTVGPSSRFQTLADAMAYVAANSDPVDITDSRLSSHTASMSTGTQNIEFSASLFDGATDEYLLCMTGSCYVQLRNATDDGWEGVRQSRTAPDPVTPGRLITLSTREGANATNVAFRNVRVPAYLIALEPGVHDVSLTMPPLCHVDILGSAQGSTINLVGTSQTPEQGHLGFHNVRIQQMDNTTALTWNPGGTVLPGEFMTLDIIGCDLVANMNAALIMDTQASFMRMNTCSLYANKSIFRYRGCSWSLSDIDSRTTIELIVLIDIANTTSTSAIKSVDSLRYDGDLILDKQDRAGTSISTGAVNQPSVTNSAVQALSISGALVVNVVNLECDTVSVSGNSRTVGSFVPRTLGVLPVVTVSAGSQFQQLTQLSDGSQGQFLLPGDNGVIKVIGHAFTLDGLTTQDVQFDMTTVQAGQQVWVRNINASAVEFNFRTDTDLVAGAPNGLQGTRLVMTGGAGGTASNANYSLPPGAMVGFVCMRVTPDESSTDFMLEIGRFDTGL